MLRTVFAFLFGLVTGVAAVYVLDGPLDFTLLRERAGEALHEAGRGANTLRLESSVRAALALQKDFDLFGGIGVDVEADDDDEEATVILSGTVGSEDQRRLAELIARGVEGVGTVDNRLQVDPDAGEQDG